MTGVEASASPGKARTTIKSTPRPRNRKEQIVSAARTLFADKGYAAVSAEEIAAQVGITAGALYRHFDGKQDLLVHGLIDALDAAAKAVEEDQGRDIDSVVSALTKVAASTRELGVLWGREAKLLDAEHLAVVRSHFFFVFGVIHSRIASARPDLLKTQTELMTWSVLAVLTSVSYHHEALSPRVTRQLHELAVTVCEADLSPTFGLENRMAAAGRRPQGRRELIVSVAGDLFHERGFSGTTMADIGERIALTGGAIYRYFPGKADLLAVIVARAIAALQVGLAQALAYATDPADALGRALDAYIGFAIRSPHLVDILLWEVRNLPDAERREARRGQREYIAEWEFLVREWRTDLHADEARVLVQAVLTVVNDAARTATLRSQPTLTANLGEIGRAMLAAEHGRHLS